jgi:hypothetical protein
MRLLGLACIYCIYCSGAILGNVVLKMENFIDILSEWLILNKLTPNVTKTKLMLLSNIANAYPAPLYFNNVLLEWVDNFKYLA